MKLGRSLVDARKAYDLAESLGRAALAHWPRFDRARIKVHSNRHTLMRWRDQGDLVELSVHEAFLPHPTDVLATVDREPLAWERLQKVPRHVKPPKLRTKGAVHDLRPLFEAEVQRVQSVSPFEHEAHVGWGRWPGRPPARSLRLGSCIGGPPQVVRIHPVLDHDTVPDWFVGFVLYHELLHLRFPPVRQGRRRIVHPKSFLQAERRHPRYAEATAWERAEVKVLLARVRARFRR